MWWKIVMGIVALLGLTVTGLVATARMADGPLGPLQGGEFASGEVIQGEVDWLAETGGEIVLQRSAPMLVEVELTRDQSSRLTGALYLDGSLYIPCDLGFGWARFEGRTRWILNAIYLVKDWHLKASGDGSARLRIDGRIYPRQLVRVDNAAEVESLKLEMERLTRGWVAPASLGPRPTEGPRDVWFFRVAEPHAVAVSL